METVTSSYASTKKAPMTINKDVDIMIVASDQNGLPKLLFRELTFEGDEHPLLFDQLKEMTKKDSTMSGEEKHEILEMIKEKVWSDGSAQERDLERDFMVRAGILDAGDSEIIENPVRIDMLRETTNSHYILDECDAEILDVMNAEDYERYLKDREKTDAEVIAEYVKHKFKLIMESSILASKIEDLDILLWDEGEVYYQRTASQRYSGVRRTRENEVSEKLKKFVGYSKKKMMEKLNFFDDDCVKQAMHEISEM